MRFGELEGSHGAGLGGVCEIVGQLGRGMVGEKE